MKAPTPAQLFVSIFALLIFALVAIGAPGSHKPPAPADVQSTPDEPSMVSGPGLILASVSVDLPDDAATYPDGPNVDAMNANCTACHSASMALYQPPLSSDEWHKEVEKMRNTFGAPVAEADVPAIVAYLTALSARTKAGENMSVSDSAAPADTIQAAVP
ncbi:hypothetical protein [Novosphingopyxis iocasae]|uniref:hypothetical protein n=1 Tax=Novosphingopyxis iocasae TaxID=2762729 RepID=UPI0016519585|nr:hypothetical protein [Novosphingopyxis iocasae]